MQYRLEIQHPEGTIAHTHPFSAQAECEKLIPSMKKTLVLARVVLQKRKTSQDKWETLKTLKGGESDAKGTGKKAKSRRKKKGV